MWQVSYVCWNRDVLNMLLYLGALCPWCRRVCKGQFRFKSIKPELSQRLNTRLWTHLHGVRSEMRWRNQIDFALKNPVEWPDQKKSFTHYRMAIKLDKEDRPVQVGQLFFHSKRKQRTSPVQSPMEKRKTMHCINLLCQIWLTSKAQIIHEHTCFNQQGRCVLERAETFICTLHKL